MIQIGKCAVFQAGFCLRWQRLCVWHFVEKTSQNVKFRIFLEFQKYKIAILSQSTALLHCQRLIAVGVELLLLLSFSYDCCLASLPWHEIPLIFYMSFMTSGFYLLSRLSCHLYRIFVSVLRLICLYDNGDVNKFAECQRRFVRDMGFISFSTHHNSYSMQNSYSVDIFHLERIHVNVKTIRQSEYQLLTFES